MGSENTSDLTLNIKARDSASPVFDKVATNARAAFDDASGRGDFLSNLKSQFGKGSAVGQYAKIFAGGGAVGGLNYALRELNNDLNQIKEVASAYQQGTASGGDVVEKIATSLPLLGQAFQFGRGIRDLLIDEVDQQKRLNDLQSQAVSFRRVEWETMKKVRDETERLDAITRQAQNKARNTFLEGPSLAIAQIRQESEERQRTAPQREKDILAKNLADEEKEITDKRDAVLNADARIREIQKTIADQAEQDRLARSQGVEPLVRGNDLQNDLDQQVKARELLADQLDAAYNRHDTSARKLGEKFRTSEAAENKAQQLEITKQTEAGQRTHEQSIISGYQRLAEIDAQTRSAQLRDASKYYESDLVLLKQSLNNKLAAISEATRESMLKTARDTALSPLERFKRLAQEAGLGVSARFSALGEFGQKSAEASQSGSDRTAAEAKQRAEESDHARFNYLKARAEAAGNTGEMERLRIQEKYNGLIEEQKRIVFDIKQAEEKRYEAMQRIVNLRDLEGKELDKVGAVIPTSLPSQFAPGQPIGANRMAVQAYAEQLDVRNDEFRSQNELQQAAKNLADSMDKLPEAIADAVATALSVGIASGDSSTGDGWRF